MLLFNTLTFSFFIVKNSQILFYALIQVQYKVSDWDEGKKYTFGGNSAKSGDNHLDYFWRLFLLRWSQSVRYKAFRQLLDNVQILILWAEGTTFFDNIEISWTREKIFSWDSQGFFFGTFSTLWFQKLIKTILETFAKFFGSSELSIFEKQKILKLSSDISVSKISLCNLSMLDAF